MSLLLDALKKAADDKQKASRENSGESAQASSNTPEPGSTSKPDVVSTEPQLSLQTVDDEQYKSESTEELTLDVLDAESVDNLEIDDEADAEAADLLQLEEQKNTEATSYTVSDEALSMLINKTNRDVKHSKRILIFGMLLLSLTVLISGGVYYYLDMQAEIANLERKHQIAMQSMRSKTSDEKAPEQSEIIRNLVSDSGLDDKVEYAKKRLAEEKNTKREQRRTAVAETGTITSGITSTVSFQKTNKVDPVTEKLDKAWSAYDDGQYGTAKKIYSEVLSIEGSNRDALLGLGAIAVIEKDNIAARQIYMSLLKKDPRDPIAIAAIASLQNNGISSESDETFLTNMLQKNPDAPHLNFALGNVYAQQGRWKLAQQHYFNAWQQDAENADYIFNLAISMDQLGNEQQAINFYNESLSRSKNKQVSFSREAAQKRITELSGL